MKNTLTKDGKIRSNKPCPFAKRCSLKTANCPQRGNTRPQQFSCAAARLFSISKPQPKPEPQPQPEVMVESWSLTQAVNQKRSERFGATTWIPQHEIASYVK